MAELERSFASNTCRCTGFRPILDTVKSFAIDASPRLCQKVKDMEDLIICSKTKSVCERKCSVKSVDSDWSIYSNETNVKDETPIVLNFGKSKFFKVFTVEEIFDVLNSYGVDSHMFVDGNTAKGKNVYDFESVAIFSKNL